MTRLELAPAKINMGLEILGRRDDGYHEIRTVLCTISLADRLTFDDADQDAITFKGSDVDLAPSDNLVTRALAAMRRRGASIPPQRVAIDKAIPASAGLGGASSDAAAAIRAFAQELNATGIDTHELAASLGSDVPFFLGGPCALASGRGEELSSLPAPAGIWVVLATPTIEIPDKTRTMYAAVDPGWWSDGAAVAGIASALPKLPTTAPVNVFERALLTRFPETATVRRRLLDAGAPWVALSGAGPTLYTLVATEAIARAIAARLNGDLTVNIVRLGSLRDG